jgi:hypothetical protein
VSIKNLVPNPDIKKLETSDRRNLEVFWGKKSLIFKWSLYPMPLKKGPDEPFSGWRCLQCGEIIDQVILENRQAPPGRQNRGRERIGCLIITILSLVN